jgi:hypothetical protein
MVVILKSPNYQVFVNEIEFGEIMGWTAFGSCLLLEFARNTINMTQRNSGAFDLD